MPELHALTPSLGVLQKRGYAVALVTDGRMSGASGSHPRRHPRHAGVGARRADQPGARRRRHPARRRWPAPSTCWWIRASSPAAAPRCGPHRTSTAPGASCSTRCATAVGRADEGAHVFATLGRTAELGDPPSHSRSSPGRPRTRPTPAPGADPVSAAAQTHQIRTGGDVLDVSPVIPVVVVESAEQAVPLAQALLRGGIRHHRDHAALGGRARGDRGGGLAGRGMVVGAGTVLTPEQVAQVRRRRGAVHRHARARRPGCSRRRSTLGLPLLAGAGTLTEMLRLAEAGLERDEVLPGRGQRRAALPVGRGRAHARSCGSARPAGSRRRTPRTTSRCPTWAASAARGSRRRTPWRKGTGRASRTSPPKPRPCAPDPEGTRHHAGRDARGQRTARGPASRVRATGGVQGTTCTGPRAAVNCLDCACCAVAVRASAQSPHASSKKSLPGPPPFRVPRR